MRARAALVPPASPVAPAELESLIRLLDEAASGDRGGVVCLTGAGVSTESGIPDYRSPGGAYSTGFKPMTYQEFMADEAARYVNPMHVVCYASYCIASPPVGAEVHHILPETLCHLGLFFVDLVCLRDGCMILTTRRWGGPGNATGIGRSWGGVSSPTA